MLDSAAIDLAQQLADYRSQLSGLSLDRGFGNSPCSARECSATDAMACAFVDEHGRGCTTAWCEAHRFVSHGVVFCFDHCCRVDGKELIHGSPAETALSVVRWVSQEIDPDMTGMLRALCMEDTDALSATPVRFTRVALSQQTGYWERTWQIHSYGICLLRVSAGADETEPGEIHARVNNDEVIRLAVPWAEDHGCGAPGGNQIELWRAHHQFRSRLCAAVAWVVDEWQHYRQRVIKFDGEPQAV